jgi:hypothetical protein
MTASCEQIRQSKCMIILNICQCEYIISVAARHSFNMERFSRAGRQHPVAIAEPDARRGDLRLVFCGFSISYGRKFPLENSTCEAC